MYLIGKNLFHLKLSLNQQFYNLYLQDFQILLYLKLILGKMGIKWELAWQISLGTVFIVKLDSVALL